MPGVHCLCFVADAVVEPRIVKASTFVVAVVLGQTGVVDSCVLYHDAPFC